MQGQLVFGEKMILKKILIVDDSRTARLLIIQDLMQQGLENSMFVEAENGLTAADIIRRDKFDLIITDILMPKMDGNTFVKKTRMLPMNQNTPIIVLSSLGETAMTIDVSNDKNIYVLQKPLVEKELATVLGTVNE